MRLSRIVAFWPVDLSPLEVAEHILEQAAAGERDLHRLKSSAFERLSAAA
jgi:hypothetical protein